jgi:uncharacterized protein YjbI with pentapeptide repeats
MMSLEIQADERWQDIRQIHKQFGFFYRIGSSALLVFFGVLLGSLLFQKDNGYFTNLYTEVLSIGVTVFIIDALARQREKRQIKAQLIRQIRNPDHAVAVQAVRELRELDAVRDGSLVGARLSEASLEDMGLRAANLEQVNLENSNLKRSDLRHVNLKNAWLVKTQLEETNLFQANLTGANLTAANLANSHGNETIFTGALLKHTKFRGADLKRADFNNVKAAEAVFERAELFHAKFTQAILKRVRFRKAVMKCVDFSGALLEGSDFFEADLRQANFKNADMKGARLDSANLESAENLTPLQLMSCHKLRGAIMPDGTVYDGRYNLAGDLRQATSDKINVARVDELARWYGISVDQFVAGQTQESSFGR